MRTSPWFVPVSVLLAIGLAGPGADAQQPPPQQQPQQQQPQQQRLQGHRLRGTITSVAQGSIVVTDRDGKPVTVKTSATTRIIGHTTGRLEDIKAGDVVRVLATKGQDGSLTATGVEHVPAGVQMTGTGKGGQRELSSGKVLVAGSVVSLRGNVLSVTSTSAAVSSVTVPQGITIRRATVLPVTSLTAGTRVALFGTDNPDGSVTATFISVQQARQ